MFPALNMELEIVRTVLKNPVNDIYVCTDLRKLSLIHISDSMADASGDSGWSVCTEWNYLFYSKDYPNE